MNELCFKAALLHFSDVPKVFEIAFDSDEDAIVCGQQLSHHDSYLFQSKLRAFADLVFSLHMLFDYFPKVF